MTKFYPLQFEPILMQRLWGGHQLQSVLGKKGNFETAGESWELTALPEAMSVIANGVYQGKKFQDYIAADPEQILGKKVYKQFGGQFPLLFKFIDAAIDLSVQLHPNDTLAKSRHNAFGKTEMWYVMKAAPEARIIVGFNGDMTPAVFKEKLESRTLVDSLQAIPVKTGDAFYIPTGTIHAIGGGILLAEIQQTSDITYRVYDWDRVDADGKARALHVDLALDAIAYEAQPIRCHYETQADVPNLIVASPYFTTSFLPVKSSYLHPQNLESFTVFMVVDGQVDLHANDTVMTLKKGNTVFLPACMDTCQFTGEAKLLLVQY